MEVCPTDAIYREEGQNIVEIDADLCSGCAECVEVCPYGAVYIPPDQDVAVMCDLCGGEPACVDNCLYGAIKFERVPDAVFSALELESSIESLEEKRWAIATILAEQVDERREVIK
jgi:Fe-S-cluster-containing dehydrogenase component